MQDGLTADREGFLDQFTTDFFSADGELKVTEQDRQDALALAARPSSRPPSTASPRSAPPTSAPTSPGSPCPTLVIHGDGDGTVPFEASGRRTHEAIAGSRAARRRGWPARHHREPRRRVQPGRGSTSSPAEPLTGLRSAPARSRVGALRVRPPLLSRAGQLRHTGVVFIGREPEGDCEQTSQGLEQRTRERVLAAVSEDGPVTAAEIGRLLGLTPAAVRRHLDALAEQSVIEEHDPTTTVGRAHARRGRPARSWVVSEAGHQALASDYEELATQTLRYLAEHAGPAAVESFARERMATLESRYAAPLAAAGDEPAARVGALVTALTADGFAASARPVGGDAGSPFTGIQLCQGHCPVGRVAEEFPAFCDAETDAISRLLGVHVQRLATLAGGAHVCTTFIPTPVPSSGTPGTPGRRRVLHQGEPLVPSSAAPDHHHERSSR